MDNQPAAEPPSQPPTQTQTPNAPPTPPVAGTVTPPRRQEEVVETLNLLHHHQRVFKIITIVAVLTVTAVNIAMSFHVLAIRKKTYDNLISTQAQRAQANLGSDVIDRPDGTLVLGNHVDSLLSTTNQDLKVHLKQQANLSNGTSFMITSFERNWKPAGNHKPYYNPGYSSFLKLNLVVGNRDKKPQSSVTNVMGYLKYKDASGQYRDATAYYPLYNDELAPNQTYLAGYFQQISTGESVKGTVVIELPNDQLPQLAIIQDTLGHSKDSTNNLDNIEIKAEIGLHD